MKGIFVRLFTKNRKVPWIELDMGNSENHKILKGYIQEKFGVDVDALPLSYWVTKKDIKAV